MMKFLVLPLVLVAGCNPTSKVTKVKVGVAECDAYLDTMEACLNALPAEALPAARSAIESQLGDQRNSWARTAAVGTAEEKAALAKTCQEQVVPEECTSVLEPKPEEVAEGDKVDPAPPPTAASAPPNPGNAPILPPVAATVPPPTTHATGTPISCDGLGFSGDHAVYVDDVNGVESWRGNEMYDVVGVSCNQNELLVDKAGKLVTLEALRKVGIRTTQSTVEGTQATAACKVIKGKGFNSPPPGQEPSCSRAPA